MSEQEQEQDEAPAAGPPQVITCWGGFTLPPLAAFVGERNQGNG